MALYNYSVRLHKTANFQRWIIFITAVSRIIAGFFSVVNFRQIYILLNVWRHNFQFVNTMRISMQHGAALAAGGRLSTTGRGPGAAAARDVYSRASNRGTPRQKNGGALRRQPIQDM